MTSANGKTPVAASSAAPSVPTSESNRTKSIATRLTDTEYAEIEFAAACAGKKVAEWLREAALVQARVTGEEKTTDTVLLAEASPRASSSPRKTLTDSLTVGILAGLISSP